MVYSFLTSDLLFNLFCDQFNLGKDLIFRKLFHLKFFSVPIFMESFSSLSPELLIGNDLVVTLEFFSGNFPKLHGQSFHVKSSVKTTFDITSIDVEEHFFSFRIPNA